MLAYASKSDLLQYFLKSDLIAYTPASVTQELNTRINGLTQQLNSIEIPYIIPIQTSISGLTAATVSIQEKINSIKATVNNMPVQYIPISSIDLTPN